MSNRPLLRCSITRRCMVSRVLNQSIGKCLGGHEKPLFHVQFGLHCFTSLSSSEDRTELTELGGTRVLARGAVGPMRCKDMEIKGTRGQWNTQTNYRYECSLIGRAPGPIGFGLFSFFQGVFGRETTSNTHPYRVSPKWGEERSKEKPNAFDRRA